AAAAPPPPRAFVRYELLEELGHGGMGRVFKARDTVLGRVVALKVLRAGIAAHPEELLRFHREAQAVARLQHRHIVPVFDLSEQEGQPYLTMAYVRGGTLAQHREDFARDVRAAVALVEKVARAVQAAHEQDIVHRDLKPGNILLDDAGEPLVSDFGLAKLLGSGEEVTQTGQVLGTPAYMAPEQAAGQGHDITPATDVWALGVVLYELVTGKRPFEGKGAEVTRRIQHEEPARPRQVNPALDRGLETVLLKCLEKDPQRRYPSAGALADDLTRWLRGSPVEAAPESRIRRVRRSLSRRLGRKGVAALLALVLLPAGLGLLAWLLTSRPIPGPSPAEREQAAALAAYEYDLDQRQPVTLIGETGLPRYYRWRTNEQRLPLPVQGPQPFFLESYSFSLLDLLPDPRTESYRLSADVELRVNNGGSAGIYCLAEERARPQGTEQYFIALTFANQGPLVGFAELQPFRYRKSDAERGPNIQQHTFARLPLGPGTWHKLSLEVRGGQELRASCDGRPAPPVNLARERSAISQWWAGQGMGAEPLPAFAPRSPLGLFLCRGSAAFENVVITPVDKTGNQ
ncbi:MAG TPA: serine/threonine-protein kinase, partial [Gemmataceae bacterium]|nr:serine/threonine-protein kinase [Gemmataceae bacterium]